MNHPNRNRLAQYGGRILTIDGQRVVDSATPTTTRSGAFSIVGPPTEASSAECYKRMGRRLSIRAHPGSNTRSMSWRACAA